MDLFKRLSLISLICESKGLGEFKKSNHFMDDMLSKAFVYLHTLITLLKETFIETVEDTFDVSMSSYLVIWLRFIVIGLLSGKKEDVRLEINDFSPLAKQNYENFRNVILENIITAFVLLVRNNDTDADIAISKINEIRDLRAIHEDNYINSYNGETAQVHASVELIGLYYLAEMIITNYNYIQKTITQKVACEGITRYYDSAIAAFNANSSGQLVYIADLILFGSVGKKFVMEVKK